MIKLQRKIDKGEPNTRVPIKKRKINVDFYPSSGSDFENDDPMADKTMPDGSEFGNGPEEEPLGKKVSNDGKRTVEMFDLMLPRGTSLKAFTR